MTTNDGVQNADAGSLEGGQVGDEGSSFSWEDGVQDKALLENPTVANLKGKSMDEVLQTQIDAQSYIGQAVKVPDMNAPSDDWGKFYDKVRPADINEYKFDYPESKYTDQNTQDWFKANAHELGLTQKQAGEMAARHVDYTENMMADMDKQAEGIITQRIADNKKALGGDYDKTMNLFERTIKTEGGEQMWNALQENPLVDDLSFIKMISKYGGQLGEDNLVVGEGSTAMGRTVEEIKEEIAKINDHDHYKLGPMGGDKYTNLANKKATLYQELIKVRDG
jgi:hypothetical protein